MAAIESVQKFDPKAQNSSAKRATIIRTLETEFDAYYENTMPVLIAKAAIKKEPGEDHKQYISLIEEIKEKQSRDKARSEEILNEMETVLQNVKDTSAKSGVAKYANLFLDESSVHETQAKYWLTWVFRILAVIILLSAIMLYFLKDFNESSTMIVQYTVAKVIILTALFYSLSICMRNFRAHKHNALVNKHRHNALTTFETFTSAADGDGQTKSAVLIEATRTIFSNQQTGYSSSSTESDSSNKIVEIIKNVSNSSERP